MIDLNYCIEPGQLRIANEPRFSHFKVTQRLPKNPLSESSKQLEGMLNGVI